MNDYRKEMDNLKRKTKLYLLVYKNVTNVNLLKIIQEKSDRNWKTANGD